MNLWGGTKIWWGGGWGKRKFLASGGDSPHPPASRENPVHNKSTVCLFTRNIHACVTNLFSENCVINFSLVSPIFCLKSRLGKCENFCSSILWEILIWPVLPKIDPKYAKNECSYLTVNYIILNNDLKLTKTNFKSFVEKRKHDASFNMKI